MLRINRVDVLLLAKVMGLLYAVFGFIIGTIVSISFMLGINIPQEQQAASMGFGIASAIIFPVIYGGMGFVGGVITAFLYNLAAKNIGGLKVETEQLTNG